MFIWGLNHKGGSHSMEAQVSPEAMVHLEEKTWSQHNTVPVLIILFLSVFLFNSWLTLKQEKEHSIPVIFLSAFEK